MTSIAHITPAPTPELPFSLMCSSEVPTSDPDPDGFPSISVCVGNYATQDDAKAALLGIKHPALMCVRLWQTFRFD